MRGLFYLLSSVVLSTAIFAQGAHADPAQPFISVTTDGAPPVDAAFAPGPKLEGPPLSITQRYVAAKRTAPVVPARLLIDAPSDSAPIAAPAPRALSTQPSITVSVLASPSG